MTSRRGSFLIVLAAVLMLAGCATLKKPAPDIEYYTLEYESPAVAVAEGGGMLDVSLRVERFAAAPPYRTDRIVFREQQFDLNSYYYHRWRANPADLSAYFLTRDLQQSGLFRAVSPPVSSQPHTHLLEGTVDEFLEWDNDAGWEAVITLHLTLVAADEPDVTRRVLFQEMFTARRGCSDKKPREVARAMSRAMADISGQVAVRIHQALSSPKR